MSEKIFVGVAWPYANGSLHLGHIAGAYLPADIFARYHRLKGNEVLMVSGSDQHGTPITLKAEQEGKVAHEIWHLGQADEILLRRLIEKHAHYTGSQRARQILDDWASYRAKFVKVFPNEYKRALSELAAKQRKLAA